MFSGATVDARGGRVTILRIGAREQTWRRKNSGGDPIQLLRVEVMHAL